MGVESKGVRVMHAMLDKVKEIVGGSRNQCYGEPADNHGCTAELWTSYLKRRGLLATRIGSTKLTARDVCFLNILQKCSREAHWSQADNSVDIAGYASNAEACCDGPE